jgi:coproporphyrinogen III oxidase-like Fe-S oxidoreductase
MNPITQDTLNQPHTDRQIEDYFTDSHEDKFEDTVLDMIYNAIDEACDNGELDEDYAEMLKLEPQDALRWLEDNKGITLSFFKYEV